MPLTRRSLLPVLLSALFLWLGRGGGIDAQTASRPERIISLVPAVTEMLFAIGAGERVLAVSSFDRFPPDIEKLPRVGALLNPDVERILSLRPDLVIVYRTQNDLMMQLERARVPFFLYEHAGLADVASTVRQVGQRVGADGRAAQLASTIEQRIDAVRKRTRDKARPRTLVIIGRDPFALRGMFASGGVGFIHDMVTAAGGANVFGDVQRQAVQATTELLIARRPDIILELRAEPVTSAVLNRELETWAALSSVPAVRHRRVHVIGDPRTVIPGPRVAEAVELLAGLLHMR
jgi:iron complex transport system substrate-binding protein